jgi:hypothetical protein
MQRIPWFTLEVLSSKVISIPRIRIFSSISLIYYSDVVAPFVEFYLLAILSLVFYKSTYNLITGTVADSINFIED